MYSPVQEIVALSAVRTPMGKFGGLLSEIPVYSLGAAAIREAIKRAGIRPNQADGCIMGCCRHAGNGTNPARTAARLAGLPANIPAVTITMACASGLRAVLMGASEILSGEAEIVVAGGMESMSTIPPLVLNGRRQDGWWDSRDPFFHDAMPVPVTERLVSRHGISRREQDEYALQSHEKAAAARKEGLFDAEMAPVPDQPLLSRDETIREGTSLEKLSALPPILPQNGMLTAGNSSPFTDGAAALVLTSRRKAAELGQKPLFSIMASASGGVENADMGEGPSFVLPRALEKARMSLSDLDFLEVNEAFAAIILANERIVRWDRSKLNKKGGAIALGHPVGCSGARILVTLYHVMKDFNGEIGAAAIGAAGGVASCTIIKRED